MFLCHFIQPFRGDFEKEGVKLLFTDFKTIDFSDNYLFSFLQVQNSLLLFIIILTIGFEKSLQVIHHLNLVVLLCVIQFELVSLLNIFHWNQSILHYKTLESYEILIQSESHFF